MLSILFYSDAGFLQSQRQLSVKEALRLNGLAGQFVFSFVFELNSFIRLKSCKHRLCEGVVLSFCRSQKS